MELKVGPEKLQEIIDYIGASLVGKILKRWSIIHNEEILKSEIRELIYEELRHCRDLIIASGLGLEKTTFKFKFNKEKV